tara:strand:+ start:3897 stop:4271 length:375 start_codon:yes stop_codon:yes gene_type:complete
MKFCEAMDRLKEGAKVTRQPWAEGVYFLMDGSDVKSYQPKLAHFVYNEDIMVSDGWLVDGVEGSFKFCDIISYLQQGARARLSEWKEAFIYLDSTDKVLVINSMEIFPFTPQFSDFVAQDWIEL